MSSIVITVESITVAILYLVASREERLRLTETAKSQARLIKAIARFNKKYSNAYPYGAEKATLDQIRDAHSKYQGFGKTGEFTLSTKKNDQMVFLLNHRHYDLNKPEPVPWGSNLAEPMRLALSGKSRTIVGLDYRGEQVQAADAAPTGGTPQGDQKTEMQRLAKMLNPVAKLISVPIQSNWDFGIGPANAMRYTLNVQPVIPFTMNEDRNLITRTIIPYIYAESPTPDGKSKSSLSDITQSFFFSPSKSVNGFILEAVLVLRYPTATDSALGGEKWSAGPTGLVFRPMDLRHARRPSLVLCGKQQPV